jgi:aminoglycoside phosphotransferase (APT) family kinase protein
VVAVPEPIALGLAGEGYPYSWAINRWINGEHRVEGRTDLHLLAIDLGDFVARLCRADAAGARRGYRSGSLRTRDGYVREWTAAAQHMIDTRAVLAAWEEALSVPEWDGPPVWTHGDLLAGNLLVCGGRLSGVIDFGAAGVGDPACDAMAAWALFSAGTREAYRAAAGFGDATWARGRGWALTFVSGLTYYRETNPVMAGLAMRAIGEVLAEPA